MIARSLAAMRRNRRGSAAVEFALIIPVWILVVALFANVGRIYMARAGVLNGLGNAAREATLWPRRSDQEILTTFETSTFALLPGENAQLSVAAGNENGQDFVDITVTFSPEILFSVIPWQPITFRFERRAYRAY